MKIASRNHFAISGVTAPGYSEHKRIIRRRCRFNEQNTFAMRECIANRAVHLWHATEAICILDARIAGEMRLTNFTAVH